MLRIGQKQLDTLALASTASFQERLAKHLQKFFPEHCRALGPERLQHAIRYAMERARGYGLETEHAICVYADLMFAFGHRFDEDPQHPWAAAVLTDPGIRHPALRVERLHAAGVAALRARPDAGP